MPIQINQRWYHEDELTFIAKFQNMEDPYNYYHFRQFLLRADDGTYILKCQGNPGSPYHKLVAGVPVRSQRFIYEPHPGLWLLNHGHHRLAGFMFPEMRPQIEISIQSMGFKSDFPSGEVFYTAGEAKGEAKEVIL